MSQLTQSAAFNRAGARSPVQYDGRLLRLLGRNPSHRFSPKLSGERRFAVGDGSSTANERQKQLVGVIDPYERYAVLIGAVQDVAKFNVNRGAKPALGNYCFDRVASRKLPTSQNKIGVDRAPVDFEFDVLGGARAFLFFDDGNHERLRNTSGRHPSALTLMAPL